MSREIRENILVGYGNQDLYGKAGNVDIYNSNNSGSGPIILVNPGQYVFYDPTTNKTINTSTWTKSTHGRWVLGVGVDEEGKGYSTSIRKVFNDVVFGHHIRDVRVEQPSCGLVDVKDVFVRGCINTDETYTFNIGYTDGRTMQEFGFNKMPFETTSVTIPGDLCASCGDNAECSEVIDAIIKAMEPQKMSDRKHMLKRGSRYPEKKDYHVVPLYNTSYSFPLTLSASNACESCNQVQGLVSIEIDEETVTFTNNLSGTNTALGQLEYIIYQINAALEGKGSAVIKETVGHCCNMSIEINTCKDVGDITLTGENQSISPTVTNPFTAITEEDASVFCDSTGTTFTPTCGFRVISKGISFEEQCLINININPFPMRKLFIFGTPSGKGFPFHVKETQNASWPRGLGAYWALRDYKSDNGGTGRSHNAYNSRYGEFMQPGKDDRINAVAVNPKTSYVAVSMSQSSPNVPLEHIGYVNILNGVSHLLIPAGDSTTRTAIQSALNQYITSGEHAKLPSITV